VIATINHDNTHNNVIYHRTGLLDIPRYLWYIICMGRTP
jgi:hypothetical protein